MPTRVCQDKYMFLVFYPNEIWSIMTLIYHSFPSFLKLHHGEAMSWDLSFKCLMFLKFTLKTRKIKIKVIINLNHQIWASLLHGKVACTGKCFIHKFCLITIATPKLASFSWKVFHWLLKLQGLNSLQRWLTTVPHSQSSITTVSLSLRSSDFIKAFQSNTTEILRNSQLWFYGTIWHHAKIEKN